MNKLISISFFIFCFSLHSLDAGVESNSSFSWKTNALKLSAGCALFLANFTFGDVAPSEIDEVCSPVNIVASFLVADAVSAACAEMKCRCVKYFDGNTKKRRNIPQVYERQAQLKRNENTHAKINRLTLAVTEIFFAMPLLFPATKHNSDELYSLMGAAMMVDGLYGLKPVFFNSDGGNITSPTNLRYLAGDLAVLVAMVKELIAVSEINFVDSNPGYRELIDECINIKARSRHDSPAVLEEYCRDDFVALYHKIMSIYYSIPLGKSLSSSIAVLQDIAHKTKEILREYEQQELIVEHHPDSALTSKRKIRAASRLQGMMTDVPFVDDKPNNETRAVRERAHEMLNRQEAKSKARAQRQKNPTSPQAQRNDNRAASTNPHLEDTDARIIREHIESLSVDERRRLEELWDEVENKTNIKQHVFNKVINLLRLTTPGKSPSGNQKYYVPGSSSPLLTIHPAHGTNTVEGGRFAALKAIWRSANSPYGATIGADAR